MNRLAFLPLVLVVACGSPKPAVEPPGPFSAGAAQRPAPVTTTAAETNVEAPPAPMPVPASLLNAVGLQLLDAPASSKRVMDKGRRPAPPPNVRIEDLRSEALAGADDMLRDDWTWDHRREPPVAFTFPAETKRLDVVRFSYAHGETKVDVAQTNDVIAIRFHGLAIDHTLPVERQAALAANLVFRAPTKRPLPFAFAPPKLVGGRFESVRLAPAQPFPTWHEVLTFWTDGTDVGFVALKADGFITQQAPSAAPEANAHWFARFPKRAHAKR